MPDLARPDTGTGPDPGASPTDPPEDLWLLIADCQRALEEEIDAVRADLARRGLETPILAPWGRLTRDGGAGFEYSFQLPGGRLDIRPDDRVRVRVDGRETLGVVRRHDRALGALHVIAMEWLGQRLGASELEFDPTWLLRELSLRLDGIADQPDAYFPETIRGLFGRRPPTLGRVPGDRPAWLALNEPQVAALERILGSEVQLVWGPPGTGKTQLVAHAAVELAAEGRVLGVAATNGAVDEVASRIRSLLDPQSISANKVIRVGAEFGGASDPELSLEAAVQRRIDGGASGIARALDELEAQHRLRAPDGEGPPHGARTRLARLRAVAQGGDDPAATRTLGRLAMEIGHQAILALEDADVVLTTLARLAVREELRGLRFESVILDEASAAPLPYAALAAAHARSRAVAVGDFQQLPPIVQSDGPAADRWLRRDVFRETGVVGAGTAGEVTLPSPRDALCAMLTVQYRMAPPIRALVSELFYADRLEDAPELRRSVMGGEPLVLLDTSELDPRVERVEGSRQNKVHAEVIVRLLELAARVGLQDVGVVSPYRQQTRAVRELVTGRLGKSAPRDLEVSTIHRFQGREKALVVIDTVDAPPGRSWFLDERRNPDLPRLLNVALSRAREMLVVVGCVDGLRRTLPETALLNRIMERVGNYGRAHPASELERLFGQ
jgi:RecA/RadA recombinase